MKRRILVCGGRKFSPQKVYEYLEKILDYFSISEIVIIQGGAFGADFGAKQFALDYSIEMEEYKAEWDKYGKSAGHKRNKRMLDEGKPDLVLAFPGGAGTNNMIKQAKDRGIKVYQVLNK